jgi:hypothetical protein
MKWSLSVIFGLCAGAVVGPGAAVAQVPPPTAPTIDQSDGPAARPGPRPSEPAVGAAPVVQFSGFVQGRYEWHEDADYGLDPDTGAPRETTRFQVRRARLNALYDGKNAQYFMQIGGSTTDALVFTRAEATLVDTWTPLGFRLTVGQFRLPFGFEINQTATEREMPERSRAIDTLFPGGRDRGAMLSAAYRFMHLYTAVVNGNGTVDPIYRAFDQTSWKDVAGRVQADLGLLTVGASGYFGHSLRTTVGKVAAGSMAAVPPSYRRFSRLVGGADAQITLAMPHVGPLVVRGELMLGRDRQLAFSDIAPDAEGCEDGRPLGWNATVVQHVRAFAVVVRLDAYDARSGLADTCPMFTASQQDRMTTVGAGALYDVSDNLRLTASYEHVAEQGNRTIGNDSFITQMQVRFQ